MRLDRVLSVYFFHPAGRAVVGGRTRALPILMYHGISDEPERGAAYYKVNTAPAAFERQIQFLHECGYKTIALSEAVRLLNRRESPGPKRVVITFDDGYRNFYTQAFPILQKYGFTATMFLPTAYIGATRTSFKNIECMTWDEVRELRKAGIEFGSHTVSHPKLIELNWGDVERELRDSKTEMETQLGARITTFAYPFAFPQAKPLFVQKFGDALVENGYRCCLTTEVGRARPGDNVYRLKRLPVNTEDDVNLFRAKLEGGYDWLALPQAMVKRVKSFSTQPA
ncbi:MAG: polysaccharide deacetylase family protein [Limisphaerales bacterium]